MNKDNKKKSKRYVIGDIHGRYNALKQVLNASKFDYNNDLLIILGDVVDGGPDTFKCVEELLKIKNTILILGNHDKWFKQFYNNNWLGQIWITQGGQNTIKSYTQRLSKYLVADKQKREFIPVKHKQFFDNAKLYYELDNMLFIHGGFKYPIHPKDNKEQDLLWDRSLIERAKNGLIIKEWNKMFIGHTQTETKRVEQYSNLICMDAGAGWNGRLALLNIDNTEEVYYSDYQKPCR